MDRIIPFRSFAAIAVASCFALPMQGQAASPATQAARLNSGANSQQDASQIATIHTYSNLVVIDVVVNDSQGNPVHGLKASDFSLLENNKPQIIKHFEEHSAVPATDIKIAPLPKLPAGLFTNQSAAPVNGPVNVLLLDYLNTPLSAQPQARKQLLDYLNKAPAGTRIAIFALTTHLMMLQGFTSDMGVLKAALTSKKGAPQSSSVMSDPVNGSPTSQLATTLSGYENSPDSVAGSSQQQEFLNDISRFVALSTAFQEDLLQKYTLNAFDMLARYLIGIPGRKNVIWFSGGFPLDVEPDVNDVQDPEDAVVRNDEEVRKTDNLLTRAQVAVYPVDARGLLINPDLSAGNGGNLTGDDEMNFKMEVAQEHETMYAMAEDTGGEAFVNTNGLTQAIGKAIENGSNYYTLTYSPTNMVWDSRFRAVKVTVDQPHVKLSYRNGYFAVDPNDRNSLTAQHAATAMVQPTTMATAMMHGGPDPSEILFKVRIRPANEPPEATPLKSNRTNPDPKVKVEGPYKDYGVDLVPDPHAVSCLEDSTGIRHCALEVWTYVYDQDGQLLVTTGNRLHTRLTAQQYARLLAGNLAFHQEISVPVKGEHYVRTAIHDMVSDRVGAVEIPIAAVARLEPLAPLPAAPAAAAGSVSAPALAPASGTANGAAAVAAPGMEEQAPASANTPSSVSVPVSGTNVAPTPQNSGPPTLKRRTEPPPASPPSSAPATPN